MTNKPAASQNRSAATHAKQPARHKHGSSPRRKRSPRRRIRWSAVIVAAVLIAAMAWGVKSCCSAVFGEKERKSPTANDTYKSQTTLPDTFPAETAENILDGLPSPAMREAQLWEVKVDTMPDDRCMRLHTRINRPLREMFNDSNYLQYAAAERLGIRPLTRNSSSAWDIGRPIVEVASCADFYVAPLKHSYPYLVPEAAQLLHDIGREFRHRLKQQGGGDYRIKVTSLLRTPITVGRLRRVNVNSVDSSAHIFATTFDISFSRFICDNLDGTHRTAEDMKLLLAEVLDDMRAQGRCYVKHERKQSCFHITTRPPEPAHLKVK